MSSRASDLRNCESANHLRPPSRANFKGLRNTRITLYTGGNRFAESQVRNGLAAGRSEERVRSACAAGRLGPARHGSFRAMRFPEVRGNTSQPRQSFFRLSDLDHPGGPVRVWGQRRRPGRARRTGVPPGRPVRRGRPLGDDGQWMAELRIDQPVPGWFGGEGWSDEKMGPSS